MKTPSRFLQALLFVLALCMLKLAFFPEKGERASTISLIPQAFAEGGLTPLPLDGNRMVTSGSNGATTYVWDFANKTSVRKYYIEDGQLKMQAFNLKN